MDTNPDVVEPTLDPSALISFREWSSQDDPDPVSDLVRAFLEESTVRLTEIRAAVALGDVGVVHRAAHSLKGMCGAIGAVRMSTLSRQLEEARHLAAVGEVASAVEQEFVQVQAALRATC